MGLAYACAALLMEGLITLETDERPRIYGVSSAPVLLAKFPWFGMPLALPYTHKSLAHSLTQTSSHTPTHTYSSFDITITLIYVNHIHYYYLSICLYRFIYRCRRHFDP